MKLRVGGLVGQCMDCLANLGERPIGDVVECHRRPARLELLDRLRSVVEQREVLLRAKRREQARPAAGALGPESRQERPRLLRVLAPELAGLVLEPREEDVEVTHLAEHRAQLLQAPVELGHVGRDQLPPRAQQRPRAADGDAHVVEALGIAAESRPGVVPLDLAQLLAQETAQRLDRRARGLGRARRRRSRSRLRPGRRELLREEIEMGRAPGAELELHLDEAVTHAVLVEHRHLVHGHLGGRPVPRDELTASPRAQLGDGLERPAAQMSLEKLQERTRRLHGTALLLELEERLLGGELQLPDGPAALGTAQKRDPGRRERAARHVVVDGREDARLERQAAERRQPETGRSVELELMLTSCPHELTIGLADELCQLFPGLDGLLLEAGRVCPRGLEQKLLPTLGVDPE